MAEAMAAAGLDPAALGPDPELLARLGEYVELHIEQGRSLVDDEAAVGVASAIWPHGRYRYTFTGVADHAGTTRMRDRRDPMSAFAHTVIAAEAAAKASESRATFGRLEVEPNGTNAIPSVVRAWLDARAADAGTLAELLAAIESAARQAAVTSGVAVELAIESETAIVSFDTALRDRVHLAAVQALGGAAVPLLPTGAGHDAGILATHGLPTAMLFVRNRTGTSHSPAESADRADCLLGVEVLEAVVRDLAG
jgi:N-carbamoyl-L-amino-acid hydrolase